MGHPPLSLRYVPGPLQLVTRNRADDFRTIFVSITFRLFSKGTFESGLRPAVTSSDMNRNCCSVKKRTRTHTTGCQSGSGLNYASRRRTDVLKSMPRAGGRPGCLPGVFPRSSSGRVPRLSPLTHFRPGNSKGNWIRRLNSSITRDGAPGRILTAGKNRSPGRGRTGQRDGTD